MADIQYRDWRWLQFFEGSFAPLLIAGEHIHAAKPANMQVVWQHQCGQSYDDGPGWLVIQWQQNCCIVYYSTSERLVSC
jgi:hypothetical protein